MNILNDGIFPAMITPYTNDNKVDYKAVAMLTRWYAKKGCAGIFATCLSSEIYNLSIDERVGIARTVVENAPEGIDVIVSGHTCDCIEDQIAELQGMVKTGAKAVVLITNRLAAKEETDDILKANIERIMKALPEISLGLYEAPLPYKRKLSPDLLRYFANTGRFVFVKDTCCSISEIKMKLKAIEGTPLKLYNANSATFLESLKLGAAGFSGVMANFHPELYVKLYELFKSGNLESSTKLQNFLGLASLAQYQMYPLNAKYYLQIEGVPIESVFSRNRADENMDEGMCLEMRQLQQFTHWVSKYL